MCQIKVNSLIKRVSQSRNINSSTAIFVLSLFWAAISKATSFPPPSAVKLFWAVCNLTMVPLWMLSGLPSHRELNGQFLLPMIGVQWNNTQEPGFISFTPKKWSQGTQAFISSWAICQPWWPQRFITRNQDPSCPLWNFTSHTLCEMQSFTKNWTSFTIGMNRWTVTVVWQAKVKISMGCILVFERKSS